MTQEEKRTQMFSLVAKWHESDENQETFVKRHDIKLNTFRYWSSKYREAHQAPEDFIELPSIHGAMIQLYFPNGVQIHLPIQTPMEVIKGLLGKF
ncbi:MAG: hypothetical protein U9N86_11295 [Bacteroidota bacterium]|nr:hypothetical protein [Bacteroidota bacterium]